MEFRCKKFSLNHDKSTMKVGTDTIVLLSVLEKYYRQRYAVEMERILSAVDVGTGCGIIALGLAQIFPCARVVGIDIDEASVEESKENFFRSPWSDRLEAKKISVTDYCIIEKEKVDLIVSNPPYFSNSLHCPDDRRSKARHDESLTLEDFVKSCLKLSQKETRVALILPFSRAGEIVDLFTKQGWGVEYECEISSKQGQEAIRKVVVCSEKGLEKIEEKIGIRNSDGSYSKTYCELVSSFLL